MSIKLLYGLYRLGTSKLLYGSLELNQAIDQHHPSSPASSGDSLHINASSENEELLSVESGNSLPTNWYSDHEKNESVQ